MALKLIREDQIPLWGVSHSTRELVDAEAENYTSYLLNYEGKEEAQDPSKAAYKYFSDRMWPEGNKTDVDYFDPWGKHDGYSPPILACDFNRSPHCWAIMQKHPEWYLVFDEIRNEDALTREQAEDAADKLIEWDIWFVHLYGDNTSTRTKGRHGKTDWQTLCEVLDERDIEYKKKLGRSNPQRKDRVDTVNNVIYSGEDEDGVPRRRLCVHKRCEEVLDDYKYSTTNDDGEKKKDQGDRGHMSDAVDYPIYWMEKRNTTWKYTF